ncbi:hypothetical protein [Spirosoma foliorum]|uniref:Uncharacterized protein n=1 Tax=Spirosoma foliorum TaxID=2710596 RepID=A0A7G5GNC4_9BACT|nr:hypothetical protein [Spirosoma foliorum]QMW00366.1 hypothetical protein H3H32_20375 [Spirosoma foliorum]
MQRYNALNDSLINETIKQRTALFEVQYQTQEKEQNITWLRQQGTLREAQLQKAQTTRNFIIVGAIMLILLLGLVYNQYHLKKNSHQQLQKQQE